LKNIHKNHQIRKSLKLSILDGSSYAAMLGLTQNYITPLALELKATTSQIGLLASLPSLTMALSQLAAPGLSERAGSRKGLILPVVFMHAVMFIPILLIPFFIHTSQVWWLIGFVTVSVVLGAIANPAWGSMMADLVPERLRGRYFGYRGQIAGLITLVFFFIGGGILQHFTGINVFAGYAILFGGAAVFRLLSFFFLSRMYEPAQAGSKAGGPGMFALARNMWSSNLGKFTLYIALVDFSVCVSAPFFTVYMLRDLHFSYMSFVIVSSASAIATFFFQPFWGRRADRGGNIKVVRLTSMVLPVIPLLWLGSTNIYYLIAANVVSGFAWSGYMLSAVNFVYDASEPGIRTRQIAIFNAADGMACCLGALIGGYLAPHLPELLGFQLRSLFTVSGVLRGIVVIMLLRQIYEVRRVPEMTIQQFLKGR
jgi:MFS family permease